MAQDNKSTCLRPYISKCQSHVQIQGNLTRYSLSMFFSLEKMKRLGRWPERRLLTLKPTVYGNVPTLSKGRRCYWIIKWELCHRHVVLAHLVEQGRAACMEGGKSVSWASIFTRPQSRKGGGHGSRPCSPMPGAIKFII